jgi:hypothetical protein
MCVALTGAAARAEEFAAGLAGHGVHGEAVEAASRARDLTIQASTAWAAATDALERQSVVREAYLSAPDAGGKTFVTDGASSTPLAPLAAEDDNGRISGMGDEPGGDAMSWTPDADASRDEPIPQRSRRPRMTYLEWHRSQLVNMGATARDEHFWQCPTTGCKVWAGPYPNPHVAKEAGFQHIYRCEKTDYYRRGRQS